MTPQTLPTASAILTQLRKSQTSSGGRSGMTIPSEAQVDAVRQAITTLQSDQSETSQGAGSSESKT